MRSRWGCLRPGRCTFRAKARRISPPAPLQPGGRGPKAGGRGVAGRRAHLPSHAPADAHAREDVSGVARLKATEVRTQGRRRDSLACCHSVCISAGFGETAKQGATGTWEGALGPRCHPSRRAECGQVLLPPSVPCSRPNFDSRCVALPSDFPFLSVFLSLSHTDIHTRTHT